MAPWDRWRQNRYEARIAALPTRLASTQPISEAPNILLRGGTTRQEWQDKARYFSQSLGVVRFAGGLTASVVSRCPMTAERLVDPVNNRWAPDPDPVANAVLHTYRNAHQSSEDLVRLHAWHRFFTGECLSSIEQTERGVEWFIWSVQAALIYPQRPVLLREMPGGSVFNGGAREVPAEQVKRFWQTHEEWPLLATSPMVGILDDCERYTLLGRRTKREARSALGLNGAFFTPERAHKYPPGPDGKPAMYSQLDQDMAAISEKGWDDDESLATLAPFSVHYDTDEKTPAPQWIKIGEALDAKVLDARQEALECIVRGLPIPNIIAIEGAAASANHWCCSEDTEILTQAGWTTHDRLTPGDVVLTLNHETGLSEWQACSAVNRFDVVDEPMLSIESRFHSSLTTANHRWPVIAKTTKNYAAANRRAWRTSSTLKANDDLLRAARSADIPTAAKYEDAVVELVAWAWTEGHYRQRPGRNVPDVSIYQSEAANPAHCERIRNALRALYGPAAESLGRGGRGRTAETPLPKWREARYATKPGMVQFKLNIAASAPIIEHMPQRVVNLDFVRALTYSQLRLFIDVSGLADGGRNGTGWTIGQKNPVMLDAVELAAILIGDCVYRYETMVKGFTEHTVHCLGISNHRPFTPLPKHQSWIAYSGVVWCPTTPNRTWFARRNGKTFFTGNSAWQIEETFFKGSIAPMADPVFHSDLTDGMFRPSLRMLAQSGVWKGKPEEWRVGYDPTPVIIHPDKASRAVELYKVGAISRDAVLLETGFDTTDAPSSAELDEFIRVQQALRERVTVSNAPILTPGTGVEGPPSQAALGAPQLALAPYPSEVENWLDA